MTSLMVIRAKRKQMSSAPEQQQERTSGEKGQQRKVAKGYAAAGLAKRS